MDSIYDVNATTVYIIKYDHPVLPSATFSGTLRELCYNVFDYVLDRGTQVDRTINYFPETIDELVDSLNKCSRAIGHNFNYSVIQ